MVEMNPLINLARMVVIGVVSVFSLINLGLSAHIISITVRGYIFSFAPLTLVTAILTILTLPAMYFISVTRNGAFTSKIVVEIAWFWFLWIMWVASAGTAASWWVFGTAASEFQAIQAFSFLNWLALMFYTTTLFILSIMSHVRGTQSVWTSTVKDFDFSAAINKTSGGVVPVVGGFSAPQYDQKTGGTMSTVPTGNYYPPQQPGTPQQIPQQIPQQVPQQYSGYTGQQQPQGAIV